MKEFLLRLWNTAWSEIDNRQPRLQSIAVDYARDIRAEFPLGWLRTADAPYYFWIGERSGKMVDDFLNWTEELLGVLPALIVAHVTISEMKIDPKLRQRVMPLDQVALFPARVIIDIGIREIVTGGPPRAFQFQQRGKKLEDLFLFLQSGSLKKLKSLLFGSWWSRVVRLFFLFSKWAKTFSYVFLLYRYSEMLEDRNQWSLLFNAQLSNSVPRQWSSGRTYRRAPGGVRERAADANQGRNLTARRKARQSATQRV